MLRACSLLAQRFSMSSASSSGEARANHPSSFKTLCRIALVGFSVASFLGEGDSSISLKIWA